MRRRDVFTVAAGVAAGTHAVSAAETKPTGARKTYVLVHGAWHGGWCWKHVTPLLRAAGHEVFVPTLTGLGERAHLATPAVNLSTHVADVVNLITFEELSNVILVGHSYAGHVVPLVADRIKSQLRHLVFVDAVLAVDGKPFLAPGAGEERAKAAKDGYLQDPPDVTWFGIPADHPEAAWVRRHLTPHPLPTLMETVHFQNGGHAGLPKTYIRCLKRRDMSQPDPVEPMVKGKPEWTWLTMDTGHDAMVTQPKQLADLLLAVA
jgi:pimeloyl-ACP methyl ester carboxylesterase